jgi:glycosyltransferase involved in cell wall biosynthesis
MSEKPLVSVIVPVYNDQESLCILLEALAAQDYPLGRFECIIIDNGSTQPVRVADECKLSVRILHEPRPGSYAARNRGLSECRGRILAFTDADCIPRNDWISCAVACLASADKPTMLGGKVEVFCVNGAPASPLEWCSLLNDLDQALYIRRWHFAATANMVTTRDVFDRVGGFDPHLFSGGDREWGRRAWSMGIAQVYSEKTVVRHPVRSTWSALATRRRRLAGGQYILGHRAGGNAIVTIFQILRLAAVFARKSWSDPGLPSPTRRLQVIAVDLALRCIQLCEVVRLSLGGRPQRR